MTIKLNADEVDPAAPVLEETAEPIEAAERPRLFTVPIRPRQCAYLEAKAAQLGMPIEHIIARIVGEYAALYDPDPPHRGRPAAAQQPGDPVNAVRRR